MDCASKLVLGLTMRTETKIFVYPERFIDPRGVETWKTLMQLLGEIEREMAAILK